MYLITHKLGFITCNCAFILTTETSLLIHSIAILVIVTLNLTITKSLLIHVDVFIVIVLLISQLQLHYS